MKFWKPEPKKPAQDLMAYGLIVPIFISAFGFFIAGIFAFSFDAIDVIPDSVQDWLTIIGSAMIVFGAECNTPATFGSVFKVYHKDGKLSIFDWSAVIASGIGTAINVLIVFSIAILGSSTTTAPWADFVMSWGPLFAGVAVALDYYGSLVEYGALLGTYEKRYEQWLEEAATWDEKEESKKLDWPVLRKTEFSDWVKGKKGSFEELVEIACEELERSLPHSRTLARWKS